jgi:hypothetical protein
MQLRTLNIYLIGSKIVAGIKERGRGKDIKGSVARIKK